MPTSRERSAAARLAKLHPDEAFAEEQAMTPTQRRALFEELEKPEYRKLRSNLSGRLFAYCLNAHLREEALMEAKMAPQLERERAARRAARRKAQK